MKKSNLHIPWVYKQRNWLLLFSLIYSSSIISQEGKTSKIEDNGPKQFYSKKTYSGNTGIGLTINYTDLKGINTEANIVKYLDNALIKGIANYEYSNALNMQHMSLGGGASYNINPLKSKAPDYLYVSTGAGLYISHDMLDMKKDLGESFERNSTNLGAIVNIDNQIMISKKSSFVLSAYFNYNFITKFSEFKWWGGLGYRYNF